jgi:anti-sigma B factor antagonist
MTKHEHIHVERLADTLVVHFHDSKIQAELAISTLGAELYTVVDRPDCRKLVLDLSNVEFLSSAMLGKLLSVNRKMKDKGGTLRLCAVCPNVRLILKYTFLESILDIRDSQPGAVEA